MPCSHCDKSPASKKCPCLGVSYCDSTCQKADWKRHKPSCPPYRIQQVPGKGKGMVATRNLKAGAVILQENPLLSVDGDGTGGQQDRVQKVLAILQLSRTLPDDQKEKVLSLHDPGESRLQQDQLSALQQMGLCKEGISKDESKFVRIVMANWISVCYEGNPFGVNASALYEDVSRINHSCAPNCVWSWIKGDVYAKQVRAIKNIKKGEEIVASYINDNVVRLKRDREKLLKNWNFECHCEICSLKEEDLKKNEELRSKIIKQHENIPKFGLRGEVSNALSAAKEKLELMSKIEDEVIVQMPTALLELYELSVVWGKSVNVKGSRKQKLKEETDEYKNRALILASKLGGFAKHAYEETMNKLAM